MTKRRTIEFITIFLLSLVFSLVFNRLTMDEIWNYGFAYSISKDLIPYRDFNIVVTPLSTMVSGLFLSVFGKNIINMYILYAIYATCIYFLMKKNNPNSYYIPFLLLLLLLSPNYNILIVLLLYIIIYLEKKSSNDYLIGIVLGLTFLTKQNIGFLLLLPTIFTGNLHKIIKRIIGFVIILTCLYIYLIINNCFNEFIDYCFLGLINFKNGNQTINVVLLGIIIIVSIYLIYKFYTTKDITALYLMAFFGICYPIMDSYHFLIPFVVTLNYMLSTLSLNKKVISIFFTFTIICLSILNIYNTLYSKDYTYPNKTKSFRYNKLDNETVNAIVNSAEYYQKLDGISFFINSSGYIMKLETGESINKYDLLSKGNNGTKDISEEISSICSNQKCYFWLTSFLYKNNYNQYNKELHEYIIKNYQEFEQINGVSIYTN